ncbi:MAG TPA: 30S ribosomal protein S3ae [Candidatus Bathyarchaeia archaeon]|nr:30S ribosomal protein S3ae [Candidatus Bathyarchaeia archaeon]
MSKTTKKVRDKWRTKEWYSVFTPDYFGEQNVAGIPVEDPKKLIGRVVETTLYDITNDFSHQSIKLYFLVVSINSDRAETILKSHEYSTDYLRSLVRRGSTRIDGIFTANTIDKYLTRVYIVGFSHGRVNGSQEHGIRQVMGKIVAEKASKLTYSQLCHEMVLGKMGSDVYNEAKKVCPLRHIGVRKSKLLSMPLSLEEAESKAKAAPEIVVPTPAPEQAA